MEDIKKFYCVYENINHANLPNINTICSEINHYSKDIWKNLVTIKQSLKYPNRKYIYPIEIIGKPFEGLENTIFSDDVITLYKTGNLKFIVNYSHEFRMYDDCDQWDRFVEILNRQNINCKDVLFFLGLSNALEKYPYLNQYEFRYKFNDAILFSAANKAACIIRELEHNKVNRLGYTNKLVDENSFNKKRTKRFMTKNRNATHEHRIILGSWIESKNYWDDFYASFLKTYIDRGTYKDHMSHIIKGEDELYHSLRLASETFYDKIGTIEIDTQRVKNKESWDGKFEGGRYYNHNAYSDSYIHICTETTFINNEIFVTDKVVHPILNYQPFLMVTAAGWLERFKGYGFKTFHPFINEQYDTIENDNDRMRFILNEIERLKNLSLEKIHGWYISIQAILKHNREVLLSYSNTDCWTPYIEEEFYG